MRQADALGLGHAILCAKYLINDDPFVILLPDVLVLDKKIREKSFSFVQLVNAWNNTGISQIMIEKVDCKNIEKYGIVETYEKKLNLFESVPLKGLVEKPTPQDAPSNLAALGRYILSPKIFDLLENLKPGVGGEMQLTDADVYDCGNKLGLLSANLAFGMRDLKSRTTIIELFDKLLNDDL